MAYGGVTEAALEAALPDGGSSEPDAEITPVVLFVGALMMLLAMLLNYQLKLHHIVVVTESGSAMLLGLLTGWLTWLLLPVEPLSIVRAHGLHDLVSRPRTCAARRGLGGEARAGCPCGCRGICAPGPRPRLATHSPPPPISLGCCESCGRYDCPHGHYLSLPRFTTQCYPRSSSSPGAPSTMRAAPSSQPTAQHPARARPRAACIASAAHIRCNAPPCSAALSRRSPLTASPPPPCRIRATPPSSPSRVASPATRCASSISSRISSPSSSSLGRARWLQLPPLAAGCTSSSRPTCSPRPPSQVAAAPPLPLGPALFAACCAVLRSGGCPAPLLAAAHHARASAQPTSARPSTRRTAAPPGLAATVTPVTPVTPVTARHTRHRRRCAAHRR